MQFESIGYNFCHDSNFRIVRPCGLDWYLLLIIRSKAYYERKDERVSLNPGSLVVFAPNTPQIFGADGETPAQLIEAADKRLYNAKENGRNQVGRK